MEQTDSNTIAVTDENFDDEVIRSDIPVMVDFWAEWCGPCQIIEPTLEALADDYQGLIKIAKLNVDDSPESAARFGVRSIPTLIVFKDGEARTTAIGVRPKAQLTDLINQFVDTR